MPANPTNRASRQSNRYANASAKASKLQDRSNAAAKAGKTNRADRLGARAARKSTRASKYSTVSIA